MPLLGTSVPAGVHRLHVTADYRQVRVIATQQCQQTEWLRPITAHQRAPANTCEQKSSQELLIDAPGMHRPRGIP